jgi:pyruvate dehydrogenase E1 component beta subunit
MAVITMREAISQAIWEEMETGRESIHHGRGSGCMGRVLCRHQRFLDHFGEKRVRDTPMAETAIVGAAIVLA